MSFNLNWIEDDVVIIFEDDVDFEDITQANEIIYGSQKFDNMEYQILDFQNVTKVNISKDELEVIGTLEKSATVWNDEVRIACVTKEDYIREIFREYAKTMKDTHWECELFDSFSDAEKWCKKFVDATLAVK